MTQIENLIANCNYSNPITVFGYFILISINGSLSVRFINLQTLIMQCFISHFILLRIFGKCPRIKVRKNHWPQRTSKPTRMSSLTENSRLCETLPARSTPRSFVLESTFKFYENVYSTIQAYVQQIR